EGRSASPARVAVERELRDQTDRTAHVEDRAVEAPRRVGEDPQPDELARQPTDLLRSVPPPDPDQHEQAPFHPGDAHALDLDGGREHALHHGPHAPLDLPLMLEATAVDRASLGAHQHDLADPHAGHDLERAARDVAHLEHLAVRDARLHEGRGHVDHQAEAGEAAAALEKAAEIVGPREGLGGDAVERDAGVEAEGPIGGEHPRVIAVVDVVLDADRHRTVLDRPDLVPERQIDGGDADLTPIEGIDADAPL